MMFRKKTFKKNLVSISVCVALLQLVGFGLDKIPRSNISWYHSLYQSLTPPDVVFAIVWLAFASYLNFMIWKLTKLLKTE